MNYALNVYIENSLQPGNLRAFWTHAPERFEDGVGDLVKSMNESLINRPQIDALLSHYALQQPGMMTNKKIYEIEHWQIEDVIEAALEYVADNVPSHEMMPRILRPIFLQNVDETEAGRITGGLRGAYGVQMSVSQVYIQRPK